MMIGWKERCMLAGARHHITTLYRRLGVARKMPMASNQPPGREEGRAARTSHTPEVVVAARGVEAEVHHILGSLVASINPPPSPALEVHPDFRASALNLTQYLALRRRDLRQLQMHLSELGLSSLGRSEGHIQASLQAVLALLEALTAQPPARGKVPDPPVKLLEGDRLLRLHTERLLGGTRRDRQVRIMVTAATELASDRAKIVEMLDAGMDVLRINCAHDDPKIWWRMINNVRSAEDETGRSCRIIMDLAGPKLRTGPIEQGARVTKWRPDRDLYGNAIHPARVLLTTSHHARYETSEENVLLLPHHWVLSLAAGDTLSFRDTRGADRTLTVTDIDHDHAWAESLQTSYVAAGTTLLNQRNGESTDVVDVGPSREPAIPLAPGDRLILTRSLDPGRPARHDDAGILQPARIGCTLPDVFLHAKPGEHIWFDDGKIGGVIEQVTNEEISVDIRRARSTGTPLRAEKGINLPDTDLRMSPLTDRDREALAFIVEHADMVAYSFVSKASDVTELHQEIARLGDRRPAIVLKIETRRAFEQLPSMMLEAMKEPTAGIMIARGDLAVEVGYARLAEVQEEILWLAEAAHIPVIWATQVLETLAKKGIPSRSEITDAAMGERAESVMLNKGPYIVDAIKALDDILRRMAAHQRKSRSMLRQLNAWSDDLHGQVPGEAPSGTDGSR